MPKGEWQKHTLNLNPGDWDRLADLCPDVPVSVIIRRLISTFIDQIEKNGASINATVEIKL